MAIVETRCGEVAQSDAQEDHAGRGLGYRVTGEWLALGSCDAIELPSVSTTVDNAGREVVQAPLDGERAARDGLF